jgi:hypothetical protein
MVGNKAASNLTIQLTLDEKATLHSRKPLGFIDGISHVFAVGGAVWYILSWLLMGIPSAIY